MQGERAARLQREEEARLGLGSVDSNLSPMSSVRAIGGAQTFVVHCNYPPTFVEMQKADSLHLPIRRQIAEPLPDASVHVLGRCGSGGRSGREMGQPHCR